MSTAWQLGTYRFLRAARVSMHANLQPHRDAPVERCRQVEGTIHLAQDTITLNLTNLSFRAVFRVRTTAFDGLRCSRQE